MQFIKSNDLSFKVENQQKYGLFEALNMFLELNENNLKQDQINYLDTFNFETYISKSKYKEHKLDGQYYSNQILENNEGIKSWKTALQTKKKDDLADCFLQGLWYMHHKKLISVNEKYIII